MKHSTIFMLAFLPLVSSSQTLLDWSYTEGCFVDYGLIKKNPISNTYNDAGGVSTEILSWSEDGQFFVPVQAAGPDYTVGFHPVSELFDYNPASISYGVRVKSDGTVQLVEKGLVKGSITSLTEGDYFGLEKEGNVYHFCKNGNRLHDSTLDPNNYHLVATIADSNAVLSGILTSFPNNYVVEWVDGWNVDISNNGSFSKTDASVGYGTSAAYSENVLVVGQNGSISWEIDSLTYNKAFGLTNDTTSADFINLKFGFHVVNDTAHVIKQGNWAGSISPLKMGDMLSMERVGSAYKYLLNGVQFSAGTTSSTANEYWIVGYLNDILSEISGTSASFIGFSKLEQGYFRLALWDDPEGIPFANLNQGDNLAFVYRERYIEQGSLSAKVYNSQNFDVTGQVIFLPEDIGYGENKIRMSLENLAVDDQYHLVVEDGFERKWIMNFYIE